MLPVNEKSTVAEIGEPSLSVPVPDTMRSACAGMMLAIPSTRVNAEAKAVGNFGFFNFYLFIDLYSPNLVLCNQTLPVHQIGG